MKLIKFPPPILCLIPAITLIPVLGQIFSEIHVGGLEVLGEFFYAAVHPSFNPLVLQSSFQGLQVTVATALLSWSISISIGLFLGFISSSVFWKCFCAQEWQSTAIKNSLAIPRSIHELIWGLLLLQLFGTSPLVAIIAICIPYSCLVAKVIGNQLDSLDQKPLIALRQGGGGTFSSIITTLLPPLIPKIKSYGGYRLECALRGATLLGVFGMGGIGTEMQLTLQSLEFREMWTSIWMLGGVMLALETMLNYLRREQNTKKKIEKFTAQFIGILALSIGIALLWLQRIDINLFSGFSFHPIILPTFEELTNAIYELEWATLISQTILITVLASGIAIGVPVIGLMMFPSKTSVSLQRISWAFLRLIPPPLSLLLLLLCTNPSLSVAALTLGLHHLGVMGRLLKEGISDQINHNYLAIYSLGTGRRLAWLYGCLSPQSRSYLAYAAYRADVILRETVVVGIVGGVGLGWQLQESLSSYAWAEVALVTTAYTTVTLVGEYISDNGRKYWMSPQASKHSSQLI